MSIYVYIYVDPQKPYHDIAVSGGADEDQRLGGFGHV
jgi:hypothetical protein